MCMKVWTFISTFSTKAPLNPCNWTFLDRDRFDMKGWLIIVCFIDFARNKNLRSTHIISKCDIHILHLYVYTCTVPQKMTNSALFPIKFQVRNICFKNLNQLPMQFQSFPVSAFGYMDPGPSLKKVEKAIVVKQFDIELLWWSEHMVIGN